MRESGAVGVLNSMSETVDGGYSETIDQASIALLAMSFRPDLSARLIDKVISAVEVRGGRIDDQLFIGYELHAVFEDVVERAMTMLSAALRLRLPGIADEVDQAFADRLLWLLGEVARPLPTI